MALVKTGGGITDLRGGFGGVYFTRDNSGLHCTAKPRRVRQRTTAQNKQRNAFSVARGFSKINRIVSYNIYRALTGLFVGFYFAVTGTLTPDSTGVYSKRGTHNGLPYYRRDDNTWFIWWNGIHTWHISAVLGFTLFPRWFRVDPDIEGQYGPAGGASGIATFAEHSTDPPVDYYPDMR